MERIGKNGIILLDGGLGQELKRRAPHINSALWSGQHMIDAPEIVRDVHRDFINAGAHVITTNNYTTTRPRLEKAGLGERFVELNALAGQIAKDARDASGREVQIAGSLPPLRASYRADLTLPFEDAEALYREQAEVLAPYVDFFICETMSTAEEGRAAATAARAVGKPVWVAWTLADGGDGEPVLRGGESIDAANKALEGLDVDAILVNCSTPETLSQSMTALKRQNAPRFGGYANAFKQIPDGWSIAIGGIEALGQRDDMGVLAYAAVAQRWMSEGATIIGGCCEIGPEHIATLAELIECAGNQTTDAQAAA